MSFLFSADDLTVVRDSCLISPYQVRNVHFREGIRGELIYEQGSFFVLQDSVRTKIKDSHLNGLARNLSIDLLRHYESTGNVLFDIKGISNDTYEVDTRILLLGGMPAKTSVGVSVSKEGNSKPDVKVDVKHESGKTSVSGSADNRGNASIGVTHNSKDGTTSVGVHAEKSGKGGSVGVSVSKDF